MRARLLFTYTMGCLPDGSQVPAAPALLIEDENVGLFTSDWVRAFPGLSLDGLTEKEIREALQLDASVAVHISEPRILPDDSLYSAAVSEWRQNWWHETALALNPISPIKKRSQNAIARVR